MNRFCGIENVLMKELFSAIALLSVLLLTGCSAKSAASSKVASGINSTLEIQITVLSGFKPGKTDGDSHVAASCVLPVHSTGGPGHVVCNTDGTMIELQWSGVRLIEDGSVIEFDGFEWGIKNRIDRRDGVKMSKLGHRELDQTTNFGTDFRWLAACQLDTASRHKSDRQFVIRGRMLLKAPPVPSLNLEELAGLAP